MQNPLEIFGVNMSFQFVAVFYLLVWTRILGIVATVPFLIGKPVPMPARMGVAAIFAAFATMHLLPHDRPPITEQQLVLTLLFLKEAIFGIAIGILAGLVFYAFESAGHMIDNQRGMSIARVLIPELGTMESQGGQFLFSLTVVTFLTLGGHRVFFEALFGSFVTLPVLEFPRIDPGWRPLLDLFMHLSSEVLTMSFVIAAPVIIAILVADLILGVANRIAPQINVWELGFNIKGVLGIVMLALMMKLLFGVMQTRFAENQVHLEHGIRLLEGRGEPVVLESPPGHLPPPFPWLPQ